MTTAGWVSGPRPGPLGLRFEEHGGELRVAWVMPASHAWHAGARAGMRVLSVDDDAASERDLASARQATRLTLHADRERDLVVQARHGPLGELALRVSLFALAWSFALLGAGVVLRRGDRPEARWFAAFAGLGAAAIGVAPASGNSHAAWGLVTQFLSLTGLAVVFLPFVASLTDERLRIRRLLVLLFAGSGAAIAVCYGVSVLVLPALFPPVRVVNALFLAASFSLSVGLLAFRALRPRPTAFSLHAWLALGGLGFGTAPFVVLTLLPLSLGGGPWVHAHWTVLSTACIPATFAIAVLRTSMFGIRRLVHRGIVYGLASLTALVSVVLLADGASSLFAEDRTRWRTAIQVVSAAALFHVLSLWLRRLVDRYIYRDAADSRELLDLVQHDLRGTARMQQVVESVMLRLLATLRLDSALLFVEPLDLGSRPAVAVGPRAAAVSEQVYPHLWSELVGGGPSPATLLWASEMLVATPLVVQSKRLGTVLWGPKRDGEVFVSEERRLLGSVAPVLGLVLAETALLDDLRELNARLIRAEEQERARLALDLHDGPLQKGILLKSGLPPGSEPAELARQLVSELRELCSRLRPAVLDDLGLAAALDWLCDEASRRAPIDIRLNLEAGLEDERLDPDVELVLFRVAQEALNNALRHARARNVTLDVAFPSGAVRLEVRDDGQGFVVGASGRTGLGLRGMRERVRLVDGTLRIESRPGAGTSIGVTIPAPGARDA